MLTGQRFRSLALPGLPNRLEFPSGPRRPRLSPPLLPRPQQVRQTLGMPATSRSRMHGALGQFIPDLPGGQPLLLRLVRSLNDRLYLRIRVKVDTITGILPAVWHSHDSLTVRLLMGHGILGALADHPTLALAHRGQDVEHEHTASRPGVDLIAHTGRDPFPKYRSISSPRSFTDRLSRSSFVTRRPSAWPVVRRSSAR
jgi:hypothetical protein